MADRKTTIVGCVTMLAEMFGKPVSPGLFKGYEIGLDGLTVEQISEAATQAVATCRFMPPPAELRELVFLRLPDRAVKAWLCFERAVVSNGYIRTVNFDDPVINATVRALGGWEHCCGMPANEFDTFLQKRFQDTYCALSRAGISGEQSAPLMGWIDRENGINGYEQSPAVRIETGIPEQPTSPRIPLKPKNARPEVLPRLELKRP